MVEEELVIKPLDWYSFNSLLNSNHADALRTANLTKSIWEVDGPVGSLCKEPTTNQKSIFIDIASEDTRPPPIVFWRNHHLWFTRGRLYLSPSSLQYFIWIGGVPNLFIMRNKFQNIGRWGLVLTASYSGTPCDLKSLDTRKQLW